MQALKPTAFEFRSFPWWATQIKKHDAVGAFLVHIPDDAGSLPEKCASSLGKIQIQTSSKKHMITTVVKDKIYTVDNQTVPAQITPKTMGASVCMLKFN